MNDIVKINNWWFPVDDDSRKDHSHAEWGEPLINQGIIDFCEDFFADKPRKHAVDIGANLGFMTSYFAKRWEYVTAFEPTTIISKCLMKNCDVGNVDVKNVALSDSIGEALLATSNRSEINQLVSNSNCLKKNWKTEIIKKYPLDFYNLRDVDLIKIDVEGHEYQVITGAENTIKQSEPLIIIEVSYDNKILDPDLSKNHKTVLDILKSWGYQIVDNHKRDWILKR